MIRREAVLRTALTAAIADAPSGLGPLDMLFRAIQSVSPPLEANRPFSKQRQEFISSPPALGERELAELAALSDALVCALKARGVENLLAVLAVQIGTSAFAHATISWLDDPALHLDAHLDRVLHGLTSLVIESDVFARISRRARRPT